jgi:hypothetical protein
MSFRKTRPFPQMELTAVYAIPAMENSRWLNGLSGSDGSPVFLPQARHGTVQNLSEIVQCG